MPSSRARDIWSALGHTILWNTVFTIMVFTAVVLSIHIGFRVDRSQIAAFICVSRTLLAHSTPAKVHQHVHVDRVVIAVAPSRVWSHDDIILVVKEVLSIP